MITSALPGEGKTLTAVNLALTLTESYERRVLVIDADLRGPSSASRAQPFQRARPQRCAAGRPGAAFCRSVERLDRALCRQAWSDAARRPDVQADGRNHRTVRRALRLGADRYAAHRRVAGCPGADTAGRSRALRDRRRFHAAATVERAIAELGGPDAIFGVVLNRVDERRIPDSGYYGRYLAPSK